MPRPRFRIGTLMVVIALGGMASGAAAALDRWWRDHDAHLHGFYFFVVADGGPWPIRVGGAVTVITLAVVIGWSLLSHFRTPRGPKA